MIFRQVLYLQWVILVMLSMSSFSEVHSLEDLIAEESNNRRIIHNTGDDVKLSRIKKVRETSEKSTTPPNNDDDDDKKTLAQQVADGKYGLIQTELFSKPVKRPGIISYEINPEVPKDNVNNFGGLQPEEIWLAENHLLVLKGGGFSETQEGKSAWPPIDNYIAPQRQVKIPPNPKVPPPFPIQLRDGGPIEFIKGENGTGGPPPYFNPSFPPPFLPPNKSPFGNGTRLPHPGNFTTGNGIAPFPFLPPGLGLYPPAIAFLPPPGNYTELDEDDPSNYYPPPYDFIYPKDNSSHIPPGPLVPGIILPPPPNFFAPLQNKTKPSRPAKPKDFNSRGRKVENSTPKGNIKPIVITTTYQTPTTPVSEVTTNQIIHTTPQLIVTTDPDHNELNPIPTLPPNTPIGGWVPIPAPRPFYISEIETLRKKPGTTYDSGSYDKPKNGWEYTNTSGINGEDYYKVKQGNWPEGYPSTSPRGKKGRYYTTTPAPYDGFKPIFIHTQPKVTTSSPSHNYPYLPDYTSERLPKETYYFYEEPHITEGKVIDTDTQSYSAPKKPPTQYYPYKQQNPTYETNTLAPSQPYEEVTVRTPQNVNPISAGPKYKYFQPSYLKPTNTPQTFEYYYYNQNSQNNGYQYNPHSGHLSEGQLSPARPYPPKPFNIQRHNNKKLNHNQYLPASQTVKPPVYEYSYSAPGYGTIEAPKVGANYATTSKPPLYENSFSPVKDPQYSYFDYQPTPKQATTYRYRHRQTQPQYYTTPRPEYENQDRFPNLDIYQTEAPYNAFFTQQDVTLLDDITKKYFSLFGQKLNQESLSEPVTTPLPSRPASHRQPTYFGTDIRTTTEKAKPKIKFPDDTYNIQSERPFYSQAAKPQGYRNTFRLPPRTQKPQIQLSKSPPYYSESSPQYQGYDDYHGVVHPNHPLDSDINVNYKQPHPPLNPHAELIDPQYIPQHLRDNSYISYQLPGSGGHFYFLTPQTVNAENFHLATSGVRYPEVSNEGYYKRNVNEESTRKRNMRIQQQK